MARERGPAVPQYKHINHNISEPEGSDKKQSDESIAKNILRMNNVTTPIQEKRVPNQQPLPPVIPLPDHIRSSSELEDQRLKLIENEKRLRANEKALAENAPHSTKERVKQSLVRNEDNIKRIDTDLQKIKESEESLINRKRLEEEAIEKETKRKEENMNSEMKEMKKKLAEMEAEISKNTEVVNETGDEAVEIELDLNFKLDESIKRSVKMTSLSNSNFETLRDEVNEVVRIQDELTDKRKEEAIKNGENPDDIEDFEFDDKTKELFSYLNGKMTYGDGADMLYPDTETVNNSLIAKKTIKAENASRNQNAFFSSILGIGTPVEISLPVSGFRITIRHAEKPELIAFIRELDSKNDEIGYQTSQTGYRSFEDYHITKIVMDFASKLVISSTLDIPNPIDYVLSDDFQIIQLALITTMFPNGVPLTIPCNGTSVLDGVKTKCSRVSTGRINTGELCYVDNNKIDSTTKELLSRTGPSSISITEYENNIKTNGAGTTTTFDTNGQTVTMEFGHVNYATYCKLGEEVIDLITSRLLSSFKDEDFNVSKIDVNGNPISKEAIQKRIEDQTNRVKVAGFNEAEIKRAQHLIKLTVGDKVFEDHIKNIGTLDLIIRTEEGLQAFTEGIDNFNELNPTMIGVAVYRCGCGHVRGDVSGIIPINPLRLLKVAVMVKE
jgi:DNA-binding protein YbaB